MINLSFWIFGTHSLGALVALAQLFVHWAMLQIDWIMVFDNFTRSQDKWPLNCEGTGGSKNVGWLSTFRALFIHSSHHSWNGTVKLIWWTMGEKLVLVDILEGRWGEQCSDHRRFIYLSLAARPEFSERTLDPQILFSLRARSNTFYSRKCWDREMETNTTGAWGLYQYWIEKDTKRTRPFLQTPRVSTERCVD